MNRDELHAYLPNDNQRLARWAYSCLETHTNLQRAGHTITLRSSTIRAIAGLGANIDLVALLDAMKQVYLIHYDITKYVHRARCKSNAATSENDSLTVRKPYEYTITFYALAGWSLRAS